MGISGIGIWQLLIILAIVMLLFGSKRLGSLGSDLGTVIKGFRNNVSDGPVADDAVAVTATSDSEQRPG